MATTSYDQGEVITAPIPCNAWLSPDGHMYFVRNTGDHEYVAEEYLGGSASALFSTGWLEISQAGGSYGFVRSWYDVATAIRSLGDDPLSHMTQAQFDTLWDVWRIASNKAGYRTFAFSLSIILGIDKENS